MLITIIAGVFFAGALIGLIVAIIRKTRSPGTPANTPTTDRKRMDPDKIGGAIGVAIVAGTVLAIPFAGISFILYCSPHNRQPSCDRIPAQTQQKRPAEKQKRYTGSPRVTKNDENSWTIRMPPPGTCKGTSIDQIQVKRGDQIVISAEGRYRWHDRAQLVGPEGGRSKAKRINPRPGQFPLRDSRVGSLLARFGDNNIYVGARATITAPADGPLVFRINDQKGYCRDQVGWLDIQVQVRRDEAAKQPASPQKRGAGKQQRQVVVSGKRR